MKHRRFPRLKMINWFEWRTFEIEINHYVDWRAAGSPAIKTPSLPTSPIGCSTPTRSTRAPDMAESRSR